MTGKIEPLQLEGILFGDCGQYRILSSIGSGWEGEVFGVHCGTSEIKAVKMIPIDGQYETVCPTWDSKRIDLRKKEPFGEIHIGPDWFTYADDELRENLIMALKQSKKQVRIHRKLRQAKVPMLVPHIEDYGVILSSSEGCLPVLYQAGEERFMVSILSCRAVMSCYYSPIKKFDEVVG